MESTTNNSAGECFKVLTGIEARTLEAIADRIFPRTDTPGAVEAGAVNYIDVALAGDYAQFVPLYRKGLRAVNHHARVKFGRKSFPLSDDEKDAILSEFEMGSVAYFKKAAEFFEMVRYHVLEGVFCEPQYGGNKEMIGWRLVEFPGQQSGYSDAYINKRVELTPVAIDYSKTEKE